MKTTDGLLKDLRTIWEERMEIIKLGLKQGSFEHVSDLHDKNMECEKLLLRAIGAREGSDERKKLIEEMDAFYEKQFCEATAELEKTREFFEANAGPEKTREFCEATARLEIAQKEKQRIDAKLEKAREFCEANAGLEKTREFCEATAGLEKVREEKQRIDAKLEKALEEKRKAAVRLKEALEEKRKGK